MSNNGQTNKGELGQDSTCLEEATNKMKTSQKVFLSMFLIVVAMGVGGIVLDTLTCWPPNGPKCTTTPAAIFISVMIFPAIGCAVYADILEKKGK